MSGSWGVNKEFVTSDINAVVVTAGSETAEVASAYARTIARKVADDNPSRIFVGVRMGQIGSREEGKLDESDVKLVRAWIDSYSVTRRSNSREYSGAVIYIERIDLLTPELVGLFAQAKELGIVATVFGGADVTKSPNKKNLEHFSRIKIINLKKDGADVGEIKLAAQQQ